ncbi:hypothetical protein D3C75_602460 [compost metagenome]
MALASAVPLSVGNLSLVAWLLAIEPLNTPPATSSTIEVIIGTVGAVVSTTMATPALVGLTLPAASVEVSVKVCRPVVSGVVGVNVQLPPTGTVTVPICVAPSKMASVLPASAVPFSVGRASLVTCPLPSEPTAPPATSSTTVVSVGVAGAKLSMLSVKVPDTAPRLPAASVEVAVNTCVPSPKSPEGVKLQVPFGKAVTVPIGVVPPLS